MDYIIAGYILTITVMVEACLVAGHIHHNRRLGRAQR